MEKRKVASESEKPKFIDDLQDQGIKDSISIIIRQIQDNHGSSRMLSEF